jgi:spore coat polysaccharide biosynthesis protein SpsF
MGMSAERPALAVVQARMSSTRLPGKVLADLDGEAALALLLRRLAAARSLERIVLATSAEPEDDPVARLGAQLGVQVSRGPLRDVLARIVGAIGEHDGPVVRITGDCPLVDPAIVDAVLERYASAPGCAYASNVAPRTFPDGLDVEAVDAAVLRELDAEPLSAKQREHVTSAVRERPERYRQVALVHDPDLGRLCWTVDRPEDLRFMRALVRRLGERRERAGLQEILRAVRSEPSLAACGGRRG